MTEFIDDEIVAVAWDAFITAAPYGGMRGALEVALPLIVAKLAKNLQETCCDESAARIRELTGAKP